jgi:hypothetical protein
VVRRNTIGVPPTPVENIVMLDDESLCQRASQAVDSQLVDGPPLGEWQTRTRCIVSEVSRLWSTTSRRPTGKLSGWLPTPNHSVSSRRIGH